MSTIAAPLNSVPNPGASADLTDTTDMPRDRSINPTGSINPNAAKAVSAIVIDVSVERAAPKGLESLAQM